MEHPPAVTPAGKGDGALSLPSPERLAAILGEAGIAAPPPAALSALLYHVAEMLRWNRAIRLTAVTDPVEAAVKHVADSLSLLRLPPFDGSILDFGSGAGFPGIPLAICLPDCPVTLLEASGKKCSFLSHVRSRLELRNVEVVHGRLDPRTDPVPRGAFRQVTTRATLPAEEAVPLLAPFLAPGGRLLLMEGPAGGGGGRFAGTLLPGRTLTFALPLGMGERTIRELLAPVPPAADPSP